MSGLNDHTGWLPVEAREDLETEAERASSAATEALLALDPRARVLALLERLAGRATDETDAATLSAADLARVLESFPGAAPVTAADLATRLPAMTAASG